MYEIGDTVKFVPGCNQEKSSGFGDVLRKERKGIVVYVNKAHRFYRAVCEMESMKLYESFKY